jgi:hypothetical protein
MMRGRSATIWVPLVLLAAVGLLYATTAPEGEFWWSDAPRHAMNGVFLRDLVADMPWRAPQQWAFDYYLQYPALTILFYPPLFPAVEAIFFAAFGVSSKVALLAVATFYLAMGLGAWRLTCRWLDPWRAGAAALVFVGLGEIALWGRQVMLEVPACAFLLWGAHWFLRWLDDAKPWRLYLAVVLLLAGLYTKQTVVFILPVLLVLLLLRRGRSGLADRHVWIAGGLAAVCAIPLLVLTVKFGQANLTSVAGVVDAQVSRASLAGWLYYLELLPSQAGWVVVGLAAFYPVLPRFHQTLGMSAPLKDDLAVLGLWFAVGYLFFSAIDLKESRHTTVILFPLAAAAVILLARALPGRASLAACWVLAVGGLAYTVIWQPVPAVGGYRQAAQWVKDNVPPGVIMFSGKRDGSFIFDLRALDKDRAYTVLRADKLLLDIAVRRQLGVTDKGLSPQQIEQALSRAHVSTVVAQRDFWVDIASMERFQALLDSDRFRERRRVAIQANVPHPDQELRIYQSLIPDSPGNRRFEVNLPIIGRSVAGQLPADR